MEIEIDIDRNDVMTMYHCWQLLTNWDSQIRQIYDDSARSSDMWCFCDVSCEKYNSGDVQILLALASMHVADVGC